jgi:hypothetical protein
MEPIIEIISKNILKNSKYNPKIKDEFVSTIDKIIMIKPVVQQLYRTMDYSLLYNFLYEQILYLIKQQQYFNNHLDDDIASVLSDYFDSNIKKYNHYMNML